MSQASPTSDHDSIPQEVLDRAFYWAMIMGDTEVSAENNQAFQRWLQQQPLHKLAWQRVQVVEQEFAEARSATSHSVITLERVAEKRKRRKLLGGGALGLLLLVGLSLLYPYHNWRSDYTTAVGAQQRIELAGGAILYLGSQTAIDIERRQNGALVHLHRGQLMVYSAPTNKPGVVTEHGQFTPVGTRFSVFAQSDNSELAVTQGKVRITAQQYSRTALADEQWRVSASGIDKIEASGLVPGAWVDNIIEANNARLGDVLDMLGRYRHGWLRYSDAAAELRVTGIFRLDDTDAALNALQHSLPIQLHQTTDLWVSVDVSQ